MPNKTSLPDAAYAIGCELPHHTDSVTKPTENATVDMDMLKDCLSKVGALLASPAEKTAAIDHLKDHARALDLEDEEVESLIGEAAAPDYDALIDAVDTFVAAEDMFLKLADAEADNSLVEKAHAKMVDLAKVDRELIEEEFEGVLIDKPTQDEDGLWRFTARVAQSDKVNKNKRLYPKAEFANNLSRVNRLCKAGKFTGRDGHAYWSEDKPTGICVRYDAVMLQGDDLIMEGVLIPTQAGQDIATLWSHGVNTEWSIVGYGNTEYQTDEKGNVTHSVITDYILDGCDPVRRGAANTRTLKLTKPKDEVEAEPVEEAVESVEEAISDAVSVPDHPAEEPTMGEELKTDAVEETVEPVAAAPVVDVDAIKADAKKAAEGYVQEAIKAAKEEAQLEAAKEKAIAKLADSDENIAMLVSRHFEGCKTPEEIAEKVAAVTPQVEALRKPQQVETSGVFIHEGKERERFMWDGNMNPIDRPETVQGVKAALLEGIEDNGRRDASNKRWCMEQIIHNYENTPSLHRYLHSMTKRGFQETATTTTALGTTIPMVLPIIRQLLPQLIPYAIASVQPIDRPEARVYFYDPQYKAGTNGAGADGSNMDDSSVFDTGWTDHTENDTKSQISFAYTHETVTATEKAVYWDYTSAVMQDMQAYYNMDVEASMMASAVDYLALEINMQFIETMAAGAGVSAGTFGTALPASGFENLNDWLTWGLSQYLNRASANISKKMFQSAGWVITGPTQATLFEASNSYSKLPAGAVTEFGSGLRQTGTWQNIFDVYVCDWAETLTSLKNKMLIGYKPRDWNRASAVFCPYIPLYISPVDATASTNTIAHSASSRNAMKVLQANGLATLTVSGDAGTALTYTN